MTVFLMSQPHHYHSTTTTKEPIKDTKKANQHSGIDTPDQWIPPVLRRQDAFQLDHGVQASDLFQAIANGYYRETDSEDDSDTTHDAYAIDPLGCRLCFQTVPNDTMRYISPAQCHASRGYYVHERCLSYLIHLPRESPSQWKRVWIVGVLVALYSAGLVYQCTHLPTDSIKDSPLSPSASFMLIPETSCYNLSLMRSLLVALFTPHISLVLAILCGSALYYLHHLSSL
ncbi:hypothetical protein BDF14DRAFT_64307 [Spinellus fusiger]|nr:hypothetical protein BDF14DRAFT_64307 [Spinellus fusiger]